MTLSTALQPGGPLHALSEYPQFILHDNKVPVDPRTLQTCNAHDPNVWTDVASALAMARALPKYGVGFVFTPNDPFYFLDIDHALLPEEAPGAPRKWSDTATTLLSLLPGAAVEISQSGEGLHVFGTTGPVTHSNKNIPLSIELYTESRFVALTGTNAVGNSSTDSTSALAVLIPTYFPPNPAPASAEWTSSPAEEWAGPESDAELIEKALATTSAGAIFGGRASFTDLWTNNADVLSQAYPDVTGDRPYDYSSADAALAQHLAFWTGKDCERMDRIMRLSALVRDKWGREDYMRRTILRAVSLQGPVYHSGYRGGVATPVAPGGPVLADTPGLRAGLQYMAVTQQIEHFKGCVYVVDLHRVFCPNGTLLNSERFRSVYGGYLFALDALNSKTTKNAWEAFTESQAFHFPKANTTCFLPQHLPGEISTREGRTQVNVYVPLHTERVAGDIAPFLDHLARVLPEQNDQNILLAYMAACVQHIGVKFQWAPLLQGCEGNGKTLFTRCLAAALGRQYVHYPQAADLDNKFNGWLLNKLFIGVEDIYVPDNRRTLIEVLKPMITAGDGLQIQFKGADQITADICANFLLNSNHKDAIRKTRTDRRFAVFFTAQQQAADLVRCGMDGDYFPNLYRWLHADGYAIVHNYLSEYQIPDALNPATYCIRAPRTSSTNEAITASMGAVEQEIMDAIETSKPGFCGGWVSSIALNNLLISLQGNMGRAIPINKRRDLLRGLGYDWHPALNNGRLNNPLADGSGKPKLFIHDSSPDRNLARGEVGPAFAAAQSSKQHMDVDLSMVPGAQA